MKHFLLKTYHLIPLSKRKELSGFFVYSFINTVLDLISIIYLVPIILVLLDKSKLENLTKNYLHLVLSTNLILFLLGTLLSFFIIKNSIQTKIIGIQSKFIYSISDAISHRLMSKFIFESYTKNTSADKNIFFRDVFQLPMTFATNVLFSIYYLFSEVFLLLIISVISFIYNPFLTIISLVLLSFLAYLLLDFQKNKVAAFNEKIVHLYQENVRNIMNILHGFIDLKTTKSERIFKEKFEDSNRRNNEQLALLLAFKQSNVKYFEILFILGLAIGVLFFVFSKDHTKDLIFLSFLAGASIKIIPSFNKILNAFIDLKTNRNTVEILSSYTEEAARKESIEAFENNMQLRNITFKYGEKEIVKDVYLEIKKGDFIAISGNSGEGKTTLLHIIAGLLPPKKGKVLIDDVETSSDVLLFDFVGYASQQPFLFQGTVLENMTMLHENVDYSHLNSIIEALELKEWITSLPDGINTPLLLESKKLSGGQKQRIALARVLYFRPKVLLLDEITNQLNPALEEKILAYLKQLAVNNQLAIVAVSHGKKVGEFADRSYTMKNGNLLENV